MTPGARAKYKVSLLYFAAQAKRRLYCCYTLERFADLGEPDRAAIKQAGFLRTVPASGCLGKLLAVLSQLLR